MHNEFTAIIESAHEGGDFAYCPEISGANGQGETIDECRQNLAEAIELILADRREEGLRGVPEDAIQRADFLNTDYCTQVEIPEALRRHEAGEATVMPVI